MEHKRVWAEIDLDNLSANYKAVRERIPASTKLMAMIKADAYGHGMVETARALLYNGAEMLGVATCEEGVALRQNHITAPVMVAAFTPEPMLPDIVRNKLCATVFSSETADALAKTAESLNMTAEAHIKIDTGMGRLGFFPNGESVKKIMDIANEKSLSITGIYTHCATSDALDNSFMYEQREKFIWLLDKLGENGLRIPLRHIGNSGAFAQTLRREKDKIFFMDMIRIGILLYGLLPSEEMKEICGPLGLSPAMRLITQVGMVKKLPAGSGISYGHLYKTERESLIATLPVGYADGYPRRLSNKARVLIRGKRAPIVGAICMDQCMADVTEIPDAAPGDEVVMLGRQNDVVVDADGLASLVGTIGYEIVCGVGKRVPRVYVKKRD